MHTIIFVLHIISLGIFWKPDLHYLMVHCKTPDDLAWYHDYYFTYCEDTSPNENFQPIGEAVRQGFFDCEEAAGLAELVLTNAGYECIIYIVYNKYSSGEIIDAHAICTYRKDNQCGTMSNGINYKRMSFNEYMEEFGYGYWDIIQYDEHKKEEDDYEMEVNCRMG